MPNPYECLYITDTDTDTEYDFDPEPIQVNPKAEPRKILDADPFVNKLLWAYYISKI